MVIQAKELPRGRSVATPAGGPERAAHAMIFTDFPGFSKLGESALPHFWAEIMERSAHVIKRFATSIELQNSWGDAIFLVVDGAAAAADLAVALQAELQGADFAKMGLDPASTMRIALHFGPVYRTDDPILGRTNFYGTEVSRAARLEPVTPPGSIYVTEPFAASLSLEAGNRYRLVSVGRVKLAKKYGTFPVYRLSPRNGTAG
jgi:class 3 adenylate cyclase